MYAGCDDDDGVPGCTYGNIYSRKSFTMLFGENGNNISRDVIFVFDIFLLSIFEMIGMFLCTRKKLICVVERGWWQGDKAIVTILIKTNRKHILGDIRV